MRTPLDVLWAAIEVATPSRILLATFWSWIAYQVWRYINEIDRDP